MQVTPSGTLTIVQWQFWTVHWQATTHGTGYVTVTVYATFMLMFKNERDAYLYMNIVFL